MFDSPASCSACSQFEFANVRRWPYVAISDVKTPMQALLALLRLLPVQWLGKISPSAVMTGQCGSSIRPPAAPLYRMIRVGRDLLAENRSGFKQRNDSLVAVACRAEKPVVHV
jgi:hypothetical protein